MKFFSGLGAIVAVVVLAAAIVVGVPMAMAWWNDAQRVSTEHSRQYTTSKQQQLAGFIVDYNAADATSGQKTAIVNEYCLIYEQLIPSERLTSLVEFATAHC